VRQSPNTEPEPAEPRRAVGSRHSPQRHVRALVGPGPLDLGCTVGKKSRRAGDWTSPLGDRLADRHGHRSTAPPPRRNCFGRREPATGDRAKVGVRGVAFLTQTSDVPMLDAGDSRTLGDLASTDRLLVTRAVHLRVGGARLVVSGRSASLVRPLSRTREPRATKLEYTEHGGCPDRFRFLPSDLVVAGERTESAKGSQQAWRARSEADSSGARLYIAGPTHQPMSPSTTLCAVLRAFRTWTPPVTASAGARQLRPARVTKSHGHVESGISRLPPRRPRRA